MSYKWLIIFATVTAIPVVAFFSDDINRAALINATGYQLSGRFAGIEIGDNQYKAESVFIKRGMLNVSYQDDGSCPTIGNHDNVLVFIDTSWRRGTICVFIRNSQVRAISWRYNFFQM